MGTPRCPSSWATAVEPRGRGRHPVAVTNDGPWDQTEAAATFAPDDRPEAIADVEVAVFEGEAVLFDVNASMVHHLNAVPAATWLCCDGETTVADMLDELIETFGRHRPRRHRDTHDFGARQPRPIRFRGTARRSPGGGARHDGAGAGARRGWHRDLHRPRQPLRPGRRPLRGSGHDHAATRRHARRHRRRHHRHA